MLSLVVAFAVAVAGVAGSSVAQSQAKAKPRKNISGPTIEEIHSAPFRYPEHSRYDEYKEWLGKPAGPLTKLDGQIADYEYSLPDGTLAIFENCAADKRCENAVLARATNYRGEEKAKEVNNALLAPNRMIFGQGNFLLAYTAKEGRVVVIQRIELNNGTNAGIINDTFYPRFLTVLATAQRELDGAAQGRLDPVLGEIILVRSNVCPAGYAQANGQKLPLSQNTALYAVLGHTYGGSIRENYFRLPKLEGAAGTVYCIALKGEFPQK